jgi:hypothetical protein
MTSNATMRYDEELDGVWLDEYIFLPTEAVFRAAACIITATDASLDTMIESNTND